MMEVGFFFFLRSGMFVCFGTSLDVVGWDRKASHGFRVIDPRSSVPLQGQSVRVDRTGPGPVLGPVPEAARVQDAGTGVG